MYYYLKIAQILSSNTGYYLPKVEVKDCNIKSDGRNFLDQPINNNIKIYENITKIATSQGDNYNYCLLEYPYFRENYKTTGVDLSKQQVLDPNLRDIHFTGNLDRTEDAFMFFIFEKAKETVLDFLQGIARVF